MKKPASVRGAILDVDGTLVDSNDAHAHAWVRALNEAGSSVDFHTIRPLMGMGGDKILPKVVGLDPEEQSAKVITDRRREIFMSDYMPVLRPQPGSEHLVRRLLERGVRVVVASSADEQELGGLLLIAGVKDLIEHAVSKTEAGRSKPDPDTVSVALDYLGLPHDEVIMVGDTPYDIEAAARIDIATVALLCGGFSPQDLADAIAVYDNPQDLANEYERSPFAGRRVA